METFLEKISVINSEMTRLTSTHLQVFCLLALIHLCRHITCVPVNRLTDISRSSNHNLVYADFHPDLRIVNLAADLTTKVPANFYFRDCTEKKYYQWYSREYPLVCQLQFSTATTLKDLVAIYCDKHCGDTYLSYVIKCGPTAVKLVNHYRRLCSQLH